jgi:hypothetical protein
MKKLIFILLLYISIKTFGQAVYTDNAANLITIPSTSCTIEYCTGKDSSYSPEINYW